MIFYLFSYQGHILLFRLDIMLWRLDRGRLEALDRMAPPDRTTISSGGLRVMCSSSRCNWMLSTPNTGSEMM